MSTIKTPKSVSSGVTDTNNLQHPVSWLLEWVMMDFAVISDFKVSSKTAKPSQMPQHTPVPQLSGGRSRKPETSLSPVWSTQQAPVQVGLLHRRPYLIRKQHNKNSQVFRKQAVSPAAIILILLPLSFYLVTNGSAITILPNVLYVL